MGSLVPGWDNPKHEPDFREMSKPQEPEVPQWLQRVRSTDSDTSRDAKLRQAMDAAHKSLNRPSLTRTSLSSSSPSSPTSKPYLTGDTLRRYSAQLKRGSVPAAAGQAEPEEAGKLTSEERINWWQRVDSSYANAKPDAERPECYRTGNYVPQHDIAKQHLDGTS